MSDLAGFLSAVGAASPASLTCSGPPAQCWIPHLLPWMLVLDELGHVALQAGQTPCNPGPEGTASQSMTLLATRFVWARQDSPVAPDLRVTSHLNNAI